MLAPAKATAEPARTRLCLEVMASANYLTTEARRVGAVMPEMAYWTVRQSSTEPGRHSSLLTQQHQPDTMRPAFGKVEENLPDAALDIRVSFVS